METQRRRHAAAAFAARRLAQRALVDWETNVRRARRGRRVAHAAAARRRSRAQAEVVKHWRTTAWSGRAADRRAGEWASRRAAAATCALARRVLVLWGVAAEEGAAGRRMAVRLAGRETRRRARVLLVSVCVCVEADVLILSQRQ